MPKVLILFAHPRLERSKINKLLIQSIPESPQVTFHDLYERYPGFNIDVEHEQQLLLSHDVFVWHHPFYWYSAPPLLKQWIDMVLELGWAYGPGGTALEGKWVFSAITTGGTREAYSAKGHNRFTIHELLSPFNQTAHLCRMQYLPPFVVQGTHRLNDTQLREAAGQYKSLLERLAAGSIHPYDLKSVEFLNELPHEGKD